MKNIHDLCYMLYPACPLKPKELLQRSLQKYVEKPAGKKCVNFIQYFTSN